ncbi:MAG: phenylacetate--CoA ligase family protein [Burkholderiales bacterium]|nr:phenylacetate--CoA ligase family protein [Burkholderiales bacterium]
MTAPQQPSRPVSSVLPGLAWPGLPPAAGQAMLALQSQLDLTQWWTVTALAERQFAQLRLLIAHAVVHVPHYRDHLALAGIGSAAAVTPENFRNWPVLRKRDIQKDAARLLSAAPPPAHGEIGWTTTSGSTGQPLRTAVTDAAVLMQHAAVLRSQLWYGIDPAGKLAVIRMEADPPHSPGWGPPTDAVFRTGPTVRMSAFESHDAQIDWLCRERPDYLIAHNANLAALLRKSRTTGRTPAGLRAVLGFSDMAAPGLGRLVRETWHAGYFDTYSCAETGPLALQCPEQGALHVQAERVLLELLDDAGEPCGPGDAGRVVITDLHNFAMPLIRYDLGDIARFGPPCACGRGLPVLAEIAGRGGQIAVDPTGRTFFPRLNFDFWLDAAPVHQWQVAQLAADELAVRYVAERDLTGDEAAQLAAAIRKAMRYDYRIAFQRVGTIAPTPGGKFDDFIALPQTRQPR